MKNFKPILTAMSLCMALAAAAAPVRQHLHDDWQFRQARLNNWYPATVPGTVHTDLMANRIIEDPYFRLNERGVQWVDKEDWIYETHFEADAGLLARERIELVFEGLDTYADVYLNDEKVLAADNMFRRWRTEVKRLLRPGENTLKVYFHSPIKVDLPKYDSLPYRYEAVNDQSANGGLFDKRVSVFARKAGYHYGWDWGPRLVTSGIWRPVYLEGWSGARISDVFYRQQEVTARRARVEVEVEIASVRDLAEAVVTVASPGEGIEASVTAPLRSGINKVTVPLDIASPKLWWTRELGEPHLYEFRASVAAGDASDSRTTRIGLRSLRLVRDKVADGTTFYFELNGEPLFAKGANYIPCDVFLPRVTRAVYEKTIDDAAAVNMNMLRVWGGGVYEDDVFYELCDERGILVWQDFMFACSVYPAEGAWLENVRLEAEDNIRRLRNHPSIAVWCLAEGNTLNVRLVSDRRKTVRGKLRITVMDMDGALLSENTRSLTVAPNASRNVYSADISGLLHGCARNRAIVVAEFTTDGRRYANIGYFVSQKELELPEADIRWSVGPAADGYEITLSSDRFVRAVWLALDGDEHFEDNYFDLVPGVSKTVRVATTLSRSEFDRLLRITHLQQTR